MNRAASTLLAALVCAAVVLPAGPAQAFGGGFVRDSAVCPSGKVVLGGGAQVVGEGAGDFLTAIQETAPGTSGGSPVVWMASVKNNDLFNSHSIGFSAVCANAPFAGHEIVARTVTLGAHSFVRTSVACSSGKVSLSGGATVIGEGAGNFNTLIRESSPGNQPSSSSWLVAIANNDSASHTVNVTAVCATAPAGYEIVRDDHAMLGSSFLRPTTLCPSGKVAVGGGMQVIGAGSSDFGTKLQESGPGNTTSWTVAVRNGPDGHTIGSFVTCVNSPAGYQIVRKTVTVN